jgi:hypothetical protein
LVAAGVDWLLGSAATPGAPELTASGAFPRGIPVAFHWQRAVVPDSAVVILARGDTTERVVLRFAPSGTALVSLEPGVYRWSALQGRAGGVVAVESYSDEFTVRQVAVPQGGGDGGPQVREVYPRQRWWLYLGVVLAFLGEWAWRQRRGLP